ncbi:MAG TPA: cob(I)yrinic acid a,c-diamide adenosyltransferase [Candidatus Aquicultor sp.]|jgi:cob(I)alamin adenosyltransferase
MDNKAGLGLLHIYTGDGKGKTTAAIGLALRAAGAGFSVCIIQFMKAKTEESPEITAIKRCSNVTVKRFGGNLLAQNHEPEEDIEREIAQGIQEAERLAQQGACNLIVLDEINLALSMGLAQPAAVERLIDACKGKIELVFTGRNAPQALIDKADYVSECKMTKHPFEQGIHARRGIEF